ncbi:alcohol dehydrogenase [Halogranum salarium B-1]|uniref:Alcohol dehydrogenase n=2 Tax=Halogranum rubrum TaxID=553466 RepID=J3JF11_9EURY|nr:alcohol dehydrogenase [Halogranum salarium B-1]
MVSDTGTIAITSGSEVKSMRAAAFTDLVGPDGVSVVDRPDPEPAQGQAVVDVDACAINRHDLWILDGDSAMVDAADLPFVSGLDVAGVVRAVGDDASVDPGDRVVLCPNETCGVCRFCRDGPENLCAEFSLYHGGLAEQAVVAADRLVALPDGVDTTTAAALPTAYMTAYHMLRRADVSPGDLVFVPGATGGVGVAGVQLANAMGARTVGTSSSSSKLAQVETLGLDHALEVTDPDAMRSAVADVGEPDAVLNHLGGPYTAVGLDVMRRGGRMLVCGRTAGGTSEIDVPDLFLGHKRVEGSTMGTQRDLERLVDLVASGTFTPAVAETYPLEETGAAFAAMQKRERVGKLVVTPSA